MHLFRLLVLALITQHIPLSPSFGRRRRKVGRKSSRKGRNSLLKRLSWRLSWRFRRRLGRSFTLGYFEAASCLA
jgi:hypothetical protein